ncbi:MAG TPA: hypothetical protein VKY51_06000 [Fredinandcohnia sp.]|nr:hypothetical protein [Fredinandcohnia sp.]
MVLLLMCVAPEAAAHPPLGGAGTEAGREFWRMFGPMDAKVNPRDASTEQASLFRSTDNSTGTGMQEGRLVLGRTAAKGRTEAAESGRRFVTAASAEGAAERRDQALVGS